MTLLLLTSTLSAKATHVALEMLFFKLKHLSGMSHLLLCLVMTLMDITNDKAVPLTKQLINDYERFTKHQPFAVMPVPTRKKFLPYGTSPPQGEGENGRYSVETFVEKPNPEDAPN